MVVLLIKVAISIIIGLMKSSMISSKYNFRMDPHNCHTRIVLELISNCQNYSSRGIRQMLLSLHVAERGWLCEWLPAQIQENILTWRSRTSTFHFIQTPCQTQEHTGNNDSIILELCQFCWCHCFLQCLQWLALCQPQKVLQSMPLAFVLCNHYKK